MLHPDAAYKESATSACVNISNFVEKLNTNFDLYKAIKKIATDSQLKADLEPDTLRLAELLIVDFEQSGIHLDAEKRAQAVALNSRALSHAIAFGEGCAKPKNDANDRQSVYSTRDADQIYLLKQLAISRHQLARLCGYVGPIFFHARQETLSWRCGRQEGPPLLGHCLLCLVGSQVSRNGHLEAVPRWWGVVRGRESFSRSPRDS